MTKALLSLGETMTGVHRTFVVITLCGCQKSFGFLILCVQGLNRLCTGCGDRAGRIAPVTDSFSLNKTLTILLDSHFTFVLPKTINVYDLYVCFHESFWDPVTLQDFVNPAAVPKPLPSLTSNR